ncbi:hypothetical protein SAMN05444411_101953 [Lutibacter oricola]|uniref:Lipoprotein n=1 Tax=Lutibacter oricola TaxID=762486 RepID=A0A1H2UGG2_9FLAO|nr:hypothetical protein [Lutibacter oricola]SDW54644.1 hypothetical protein SAMN05444411_101953 [Lutibacter oricola]
MKKVLYLIIIVTTLFSCSKTEIKVPVLAYEGIQELHNHSQVWLFFEIKNNDTIAKVNRKNTISTTHWIFNIDKKLPLKAITPTLTKLKYKHANGIHSKEGMSNYFSYSDTISKKLSFIEFDKTEYKTDSLQSKYFIKTNAKDYLKYNNINITFNPNNLWINDGKFEKEDFKKLLLEYVDFSAEGKQTMLHTNYNQNLTYQDYLYYKTLLLSINQPAILINPLEFVFDPNKVPDCGCE